MDSSSPSELAYLGASTLPSAAARPPAKAPRIAAPNATMAVSTRQVSSVAMIFATNTVIGSRTPVLGPVGSGSGFVVWSREHQSRARRGAEGVHEVRSREAPQCVRVLPRRSSPGASRPRPACKACRVAEEQGVRTEWTGAGNKARAAAWYRANTERGRANAEASAKANPDRVRATKNKWAKADPDAGRATVQRRRTRIVVGRLRGSATSRSSTATDGRAVSAASRSTRRSRHPTGCRSRSTTSSRLPRAAATQGPTSRPPTSTAIRRSRAARRAGRFVANRTTRPPAAPAASRDAAVRSSRPAHHDVRIRQGVAEAVGPDGATGARLHGGGVGPTSRSARRCPPRHLGTLPVAAMRPGEELVEHQVEVVVIPCRP